MRCPACDSEVVAEAIYCHRCGERLLSPDTFDAAGDAMRGSGTSPAAGSLRNTAAENTGPDEPERELWRGGYSPKAMVGGWVISILITLALLAIGGYWARTTVHWSILLIAILIPWIHCFAVLSYRRLSVRYQLTTQRFIHELGILRRVTNRIEALDMDDITFEQGFLERLVGVGTIHIFSSDRTDPQIALRGIEDVERVSELFDDARRTERRRHGLHIEQI